MPATLIRRNSSHSAPVLDLGGGVEDGVGAARAALEHGRVAEVARNRLGSRSRTRSAAPVERARAHTVQPSRTRRSIRRPPMKPEPPVTNAVLT